MIRQPLPPRDQLAVSVPLPSALQAGVLEVRIQPRYILHLAIICLALTVIALGGLNASQGAREGGDSLWPLAWSASSAFRQSQYLSKPILPFTLKSPLGALAVERSLATPPLPGPEAKAERPLMIEYSVIAGDNLFDIAARFGLDTESVIWANQFVSGDLIGVGDRIRIPSTDGVLLLVKEGDTVASLAQRYGVDPAAITEYKLNELSEPYDLDAGQLLMIPGGRMPDPPRPVPVSRGASPAVADSSTRVAPAQAPATPPTAGSGRFAWPTYGPIFTYFGEAGHQGIDISPSYGTPIYAADAGRVISALYWNYSYGYHLIIDHGNGFTTLYGHASRFNVSAGEYVNKGQLIAWVGSTGKSTGPHLHFEIRRNGVAVNPLNYLP